MRDFTAVVDLRKTSRSCALPNDNRTVVQDELEALSDMVLQAKDATQRWLLKICGEDRKQMMVSAVCQVLHKTFNVLPCFVLALFCRNLHSTCCCRARGGALLDR